MSEANGRDLAIFDLCDTLAATNTTFAFLDFYAAIGFDPARKKTFDRWTSRRSPLFYAAAVIQRITGADIARQRVIAQLAGEKRETIMGAAIRFSKEILPSLMNEPLLRRLSAHKSAGDQVLIVSSSLDVIVAPIAAHLDVQFLASTLGFDGERCTGRIEHDLTGSKLAALRERGLLGKRSIHVYTDNRSDAQLLEVAQHRNIVLPRGRGNHHWGGADCEYIEL